MTEQAAITVEDVSKQYRLYHERNQSLKAAIMRRARVKYEEFWALRDVSFEVPEGATFAIIGENVEFIQLITDKTRGRQLPIPYTEVFSQADFMQ